MHGSEISATAHLQTNNRPCIGLVWVCVWYCFFRFCFLLLHLYRSECCLNLRRMYVIQIYGKKNVRVKSIYSQTCGKNIGSNICGKFCYWILLSFLVDFFFALSWSSLWIFLRFCQSIHVMVVWNEKCIERIVMRAEKKKSPVILGSMWENISHIHFYIA